MSLFKTLDSQRTGIICVVGAWLCFSCQDAVIKWISGDYALHQITLTRSVIGMLFTLLIFMPREGGYTLLKTNHLKKQLARGILIVFSNFFFFAAIVAIPLGEAMAIFFVAPLLITILSVIFLGEQVGWRRWGAVFVGFSGVIVMLQPGTDSFQVAALFPMMAALCYASAQVVARKMNKTERASTMAFYIQLVFIVVSLAVGLSVGDGRFGDTDQASMAFLLRQWHWPAGGDVWLFVIIGVLSGIGAYLISQGYKLCEAGVAAPFEYVALPLAVMWSIVIWRDWPELYAWLGIVLIASAGLYVFYRETRKQDFISAGRPIARHK